MAQTLWESTNIWHIDQELHILTCDENAVFKYATSKQSTRNKHT